MSRMKMTAPSSRMMMMKVVRPMPSQPCQTGTVDDLTWLAGAQSARSNADAAAAARTGCLAAATHPRRQLAHPRRQLAS